jgi:GTP-binding protein
LSSPLVAIIGAPNVGKSTLFNRLVRRRRSIVTDEPGVTRDRVYGEVSRAPRPFRVVDTGGLALSRDAPLAHEIERQVQAALREAAAAMLVVDVRAGLTSLDREIAARLRRGARPVILVANKVDAPSAEPALLEFHALGLGDPVAVSAEHGHGLDALLDRIAEVLPHSPDAGLPEHREDGVRIAIVGRPNVGKSSLVNRLLGEERVMVSEVPGTTRDVVDTRLERDGRSYVLLDTAGIRRKGSRRRPTAETLAVAMAHKGVERADVVVLVVDGSQDLASQDAHIAGYAHDAAKPMVIVVNKWDLVKDKERAAKAWRETVERRLSFARGCPLVFASAKSGQRVEKLLEPAAALHAAAGLRIPTAELNRWLDDVARRESASPARGRSVKLLYATQTGIRPPQVVVFCNAPRSVHFSLRRFLENSLRHTFGFGSVPIRLQFRGRKRRMRA